MLINQEIISFVHRANSFDAIRYFLATSLICVHFFHICGIEQPWWVISGNLRVKGFFVITGFLVLYSIIKRNNLASYAKKRFLRIFPAYAACIVLAWIAGMFLSDLSIAEFLTNPESWKYLFSNLLMLNFLCPDLPGLFSDNLNTTAVNGSLWSMKVEVAFYVFVPIFVWLMKKKGKAIPAVVIYLLTLLSDFFCQYMAEVTGSNTWHMISLQFFGRIMYFIAGAIILLWFDKIERHRYLLFFLSVAQLLVYHNADIIESFLGSNCETMLDLELRIFEPIAFAFVLIFAAYHLYIFNFLRKYDNISYGMYLYHWPVIQIVISLGIIKHSIFEAFAIAFILIMLLAIGSWYLIEKPCIAKAHYSRF